MSKYPVREKEEEEIAEPSDNLYERMNIIIDKGQEPLRLDRFLTARIQNASRTKIQSAIESGRIMVNNKIVQPNYKVRPSDEIIMYSDKEVNNEEIIAEEVPLQIVFEDDDILIIDKPPGLVVHPASGNYSGTVINGIAWRIQQANPEVPAGNLPRFGLVHRIDKNTSGLLVLAKNEKSLTSLAKQFFDQSVKRQYVALVWGDFKDQTGTVKAHIGRHKRFRKIFDAYPDGEQGKEATTHYKVLERFGYVSLIQCELETGRTHQIRVHMQHIGHPLFNDVTYGGDKIVKGTVFTKYKQFVENCFAICPRQALHARTLGFIHPVTRKEVLFESELPEDMKKLIEKWRSYATNKGA